MKLLFPVLSFSEKRRFWSPPQSVSWSYGATHDHFFFFRTVNLENPVLQQVLERRNEVLCVLTQKIVTTQKCVISEHVQTEEKCGGMVGIQTKIVQVPCPSTGTFPGVVPSSNLSCRELEMGIKLALVKRPPRLRQLNSLRQLALVTMGPRT